MDALTRRPEPTITVPGVVIGREDAAHAIDPDMPAFDLVAQCRWDQAMEDVGSVCEKGSPDYDPVKCADSREKKDQARSDVQTLVFDKEQFDIFGAKEWADDHDFTFEKVDETENSIRIRQRDPSEFQQGSFRTITLARGVQAVIGRVAP